MAQLRRRQTKDQKKMIDAYKLIGGGAGIVVIIGAVWGAIRFVIAPLWRKRYRPKLELIDRFRLGEEGIKSAGRVSVFLQNTGKTSAKDILVELKIVRPRDANPGSKMFFNEDIGYLESYEEPSFLETDRWLKPEVYSFRLKPEMFVNPGHRAALKIVYFVVFTVEDTHPGGLDLEIEWTIHCADNPLTTGTITRMGEDLKRQLLKNQYESGRVIGYEIPSNQLPADDSE